MSDGLTTTARSVAAQAVAVLVGFAVVGAVCGVVWWWAWTPPRGTVQRGGWYPDETGLRGEYRGVGWYVVVALAAGVIAGLLAAWLAARAELATLAAVLVGSVLAAWLMQKVGQHLGPADPTVLARTTTRTSLPGDLSTDGWPPLVALPLGSTLSLCLFYLFSSPTKRRG